MTIASGPLHGLKIVEMAGIGPGPFCAMMLADMGAEVIRVDRKGVASPIAVPHPRFDVTTRGRRSLVLDLKKPGGAQSVLRLVDQADALIEGFRPGVMERLGLGPEVCLARNPRLIFGRMTGWGQTGPLAGAAGHDLNYIALTGALYAIGSADRPPSPPLNLVGDYGGGAVMLAFGLVCALFAAARSGRGQVVDAAMTDGAALLASSMYGLKAAGVWSGERASNVLDGAAHFYGTYTCADGKFVAIGAIEPHFFRLLCERIGIEVPDLGGHFDRETWPELKRRIAAVIATRTRAEWCEILEGTDACFAPVLDWDEAPAHPHNVARGTFIEIDGVIQPAPAPRFSRTPGGVQRPPAEPGEHTESVLADWGFTPTEIESLRGTGAI